MIIDHPVRGLHASRPLDESPSRHLTLWAGVPGCSPRAVAREQVRKKKRPAVRPTLRLWPAKNRVFHGVSGNLLDDAGPLAG
jgi:hypothetical protein